MIYTSQLLVFTRLGHDELADIIPLAEIVSVTGYEAEREVDPFRSLIEEKVDNSDDPDCPIEIKTIPDGYNSGRVYRIRVISEKDRRAIIEDLTRFSAREQEKAISKSKFKKLQDKVAAVVNSNLVQRFLAFLIVMVRSLEYA
jgi:hypothetical protein